jgi:hypothetical protein
MEVFLNGLNASKFVSKISVCTPDGIYVAIATFIAFFITGVCSLNIQYNSGDLCVSLSSANFFLLHIMNIQVAEYVGA